MQVQYDVWISFQFCSRRQTCLYRLRGIVLLRNEKLLDFSLLVNKTEINFTKLIKSWDVQNTYLSSREIWLVAVFENVCFNEKFVKTCYGLLKIIDGLTKCIKVLTSKSTWWGAETIHLKCYTNTWLHYYGPFSIFVKLIRHKQRCVTTKGEAPDALILPNLTFALLLINYLSPSRLRFPSFIFSFFLTVKFKLMQYG